MIAYVGSYETPEKRDEMAETLRNIGAAAVMYDWAQFESCLEQAGCNVSDAPQASSL